MTVTRATDEDDGSGSGEEEESSEIPRSRSPRSGRCAEFLNSEPQGLYFQEWQWQYIDRGGKK